MKTVVALILCYLFFLVGLSESLAQVIIDAEIRPRTEFRSGFNRPLSETLKSSFFTIQRTRLNFNYISGLLNARLTLQDARVFGETDTKQPATATAGNISIYEVWAEILLLSGTSFRIRRQGVKFEDGRLFSLSPWSNTGNAHDLIQVQYANEGLDVQLGYALNNEKALNADTLYYSIFGCYFANKGTNLLKYEKTTVNTRFPQYAYLMLTVRPQFCKTSSYE